MNFAAPIFDDYILMLNNRNRNFTLNTWKSIDELFHLLDKIKPCGNDNKRELWLTIPRGNIEDYGNYSEYLEEGIVSNKSEFEEIWKRDYPNEFYWYKLNTVSFIQNINGKDFKAIFLNNRLISQSSPYDSFNFELDISDFINCIIEAVKSAIAMLEDGTYNNFVKNNLSCERRFGIINRHDYWNVYKEEKDQYLSNFSTTETSSITEFINWQENIQSKEVSKYTVSKEIGRISEMTSNNFYNYCSLGYKKNNYEDCDKLTPKELYYKYADGRDAGLKDINGDSPSEFDNWYVGHTQGAHPWEVCAGGNSTHVSLYVCHDEDGYYLEVAGKSYGRSVETLKFFLALKQEGLPVYLTDGNELLNRLLGKGKIGIVPDFVVPVYCESAFEDEDIIDFVHLRINDKSSELLPFIEWLEIEEQWLS